MLQCIVPPRWLENLRKASPSKKDNDLVPIDEEPVQKGKRVKRPAKKSTTKPTAGVVIREALVETKSKSKEKEKVDVTHGKGIELLSEVVLTKEAQMKERNKDPGALLHNNIAQDMRERSLNVSFENDTFQPKKTQKTLLKQMYETFNASSSELLDSIFNRLQKIISQLTILGEIITPEELNLKFLRSLPTEWGMHVVVWRNKSDLGSISFDDLYNNFKIVEPEVKRSVISSSNSGSQNCGFPLQVIA
ncbi:hypothetical protein Tco_1351921 [Tanacetum coccineum]